MRPLRLLVPLAALVLAGCADAPPDRPPADPDEPSSETTDPSNPDGLTGRAWVATDSAAAPGRLHVFLPDFVVSTSCVETYRVDPWRAGGDGRIVITEGTVEIPTAWTQDGDALTLTKTLVGGETVEEHYRAVAAPALCPDLR